MGIWTTRESSHKRPSSPIAIDRKVFRFRRLVEQHGEVLDLFADLKEKQSGDYILDRQYIEAGLDRVYEGVRRILYDMHVILGSGSAEGYEQLDTLRSVSEKILRETHGERDPAEGSAQEEEPDWETQALQALLQDLTRLPAYGSSPDSKDEKSPAAPESLTEWAGWAHLKAAQWMTDHLPRLSQAPAFYLLAEETEPFGFQVFVLGDAKETESEVAGFLTLESSAKTASSFPLLPLRYFLEGLRQTANGTGARQLRLVRSRKQRAGQPAAHIQLFTGEDFLLFRFPSPLSVRLLWCSLSVQQSENLLYLYGKPPPGLFGRPPLEPFVSEREPFPVYRCGISGRWMYWASRFSWAQGEERIRMLGHTLAEGWTVRGTGATDKDVSRCLQEGLTVFLKQTAFHQKEVNAWKSL